MREWSPNVNTQIGGTSIGSQPIQYLRRTFPGDNLSVLPFIFCVNPLSYLLNKLQGYRSSKNANRNQNISYLFFVDDLQPI